MSSRQVVRRGFILCKQNITRQEVSLLTRTRAYATAQSTTKSVTDESQLEHPQLPDVSRQYLPPKGWQDDLLRRNHGDPLHEREELYSMWGPDIPPNNLSPYTALRHFAIAATGIVSVGLLLKYALTPDPPAVRRQYPYDGLVKELGGLQQNKAPPLDSEGEN